MAIRLFNTLTVNKEEFAPLEDMKVGLYTCGPTVYNFAHVGNFRSYVFEDLLRRHLVYHGYDVHHVMNLTEIIRTCRETGRSLEDLTEQYTEAFLNDIDTLNIWRADEYPKATDHIPDIVQHIKGLIERGHAYESKGSVYFRIGSFDDYGKLSHKDMEGLQQNASGRIDSDEYETEDVRDFALWKAYTEDDGDIFWDTEISKGRPGWHIECSTMSMKYLGRSFDIHCGGVDLIFPHHENEIAQSEALTGKPFVKYWLHCEHLIVEGKKMSKSAGNFFTLRDLLDKGYDPMAIRYVLLATHYRQRLNFTFDGLEAAAHALDRIREFKRRLQESGGRGTDMADEIAEAERKFGDALDDDLNVSVALAVLFDFIRDANRLMDEGNLSSEGAAEALALLERFDSVLGVMQGRDEAGAGVPEDVMALVHERQQARRDKDFARADDLRDTLAERGWVVKDTPDGPRVTAK